MKTELRMKNEKLQKNEKGRRISALPGGGEGKKRKRRLR